MAKFWKDCLYPRTVFSDGRWVQFTDDDVKNAVRINSEKVKAGWNIPVCYGHRDSALPMKLSADDVESQREKAVCGWLEDFRIKDGRAETLVNIPDEADAEQAKKIRFVSPQVQWNWIDPEGNKWPGLTIQHLALTARPVQHKQDPIQLSLDKSAEVVHVSKFEGSIRLGAESMDMKKLYAALLSRGLHIPEDTTPQNFMDRLYVAALQGQSPGMGSGPGSGFGDVDEGAGMGDDEAEEDVDGATGAAAGDIDEEPQKKKVAAEAKPVAMSLAKAEEQAANLHRGILINRVKALKKVPEGMKKKLADEFGRVKLGFTESGDLKLNPAIVKLQTLEEVEGSPIPLIKGKPAKLGIKTATPLYRKDEHDLSDEDVEEKLAGMGLGKKAD